MPYKINSNRHANVLIATLIVLSGVAAVLALSSDRLVGTRNLQSVNLARQQAAYAAETVAALVETKLVDSSGDLNALTEDVNNGGNESTLAVIDRWLQQGYYAGKDLKSTGMWVGNCLVFWRIEPVKIYSETIADTNGNGRMDSGDTLATAYTDNYQANPNIITTPTVTWVGAPMDEFNPGYFHFRITTQAYFVDQKEWSKAQLSVKTADPWTKPQQALASSQTQRMVQLKLINLFRYVLFYGASGQTGDIEINPGPNLDIMGAVHTNGTLYLGGKGNTYLKDDYHGSASSGGTLINIGSNTKKVTVTGVDGIYRMRKVSNFYYQDQNNMTPSFQIPGNVPVSHELSGDTSASTNIKINGKEITFNSDSRSALSGHSELVRDRQTRGAQVVNTLANIPEMAGYPFEAQRVVDQGVILYQTKTGGFYTTRPNDFDPGEAEPLYYASAIDYTVDTAVTPFPVYATDMPLYEIKRTHLASGKTIVVRDVLESFQPTAPGFVPVGAWLDGNPAMPVQRNTFLAHPQNQLEKPMDHYDAIATQLPFESRGYYLQQSLFGKENSGTTGLTIRERGAQNTAWPMLDGMGVAIGGIADLPIASNYPSDAAFAQAMSCFMARNYAVYLSVENSSPVDITAAFFGINDSMGVFQGGYSTLSDVPATQERVMNRRDANSYRMMGLLNNDATAGAYFNDVLTLNLERIQAIIRGTTWSALYPATTRSAVTNTRTLFNGLIYAHRTPRLNRTAASPAGMPMNDTLMPLRYHPLAAPGQINLTTLTAADPIYGFNGGLYPIVGSVNAGLLNVLGTTPYRIGETTTGSWTVYPSTLQVRVKNAATINWGMTQKSGRLQGLTIVTPNHCYIQGNYNVTMDAVKGAGGKDLYPPCAVFADGVTMLTNLWKDSEASYTATKAGDSTTYNLSLVINNVPTDFVNAWDEGSGGTHNLLRFLEGGSRDFRFMGSMVVLNRMRYSRNFIGAASGWYGAPRRYLNFNDDLLTAEGQPPFSPWGIQVTRVVSSINIAAQ